MYKYDLHVHTKETSPCAHVAAADMIEVYRDNGYSGVVITDHYRPVFFNTSEFTTWEEKVEEFLRGYRNAKYQGDKYGMDVLLGIEFAFNNTKTNDFLIYGITEEMLMKSTDLFNLGFEGLSKFCKENNLLFFQAHPLRGYCNLEDIAFLDGVEVHNGNPRHDSHNDEIEVIASENDLYMISGSDFHEYGDENNGGIITSNRIKTNDDLIEVLKSKDYTLFRG